MTQWTSRLQGYVPAIGALGIAIALHSVVLAILGPSTSGAIAFFLYLLTFLIAACCGYGPGLLVTILITCSMPYLFKPNFSIRNVDVPGVTIFLLLSVIVTKTMADRRRSEALLRRMNAELDQRVEEQTKTLRDQLAEVETLYAKLSVGLCFLDTELRFLRVNDSLAAVHGPAAAAHLGQNLRRMVSKEWADVVEPLYRRVLQSKEAVLDHEIPGPATGTGAGRFWSISCSPVATDLQLLGLQVIVQDITERKKAEQALNQSNASLRRANEDLEQFAFSASHDLREPIRSVAIYSQLLKQRFSGALGAEGDEYIRFTVQGARRMEHLVRDLLTYAQTSLADVPPSEPENANEALQQALSNLQAAILETGAVITCSDLPSIPAPKTQLIQLFQNLIGNAILYRRQETPRVEITAETRPDNTWLFQVKDNGIGIEKQYQQQVFGIFKRLHRHEEYPGTGIGLAICRKIVEQHGGRIWVDSEADAGATFLFTLPAAKVQDIQSSRLSTT